MHIRLAGPLRSIAQVLQRPLVALMSFILERPAFSVRLTQLLLRYPALHQQLRSLAIRAGLMSEAPMHQESPAFVPKLVDLTPQARQIYDDLTLAIEQRQAEHH